MRLEDLAQAGPAVPLALLGADRQLARGVQEALGRAGLLDPPADGHFGPVSHWALARFLAPAGPGEAACLDAGIARLLLDAHAGSLDAPRVTDDFAGRIVQVMQDAGHWICRDPDAVNIVYIEGMNLDGTANGNAPNAFNDIRLALRVGSDARPSILDAWTATTEPGSCHTLIELLDPRGAARIAFGQWKAWSVGAHNAGKATGHEALVQTAPIQVHRDLDRDFQRAGDKLYQGNFGINQHGGFDQPLSDIGRASAGCLVGRTKSGHRAFMSLCKSDPRYRASHGYRFMTTVLHAAQFLVP